MISIINFFILILLFKETIGQLCEDGWLYFKRTKSCYLLIEKPTTFNHAQFACLIKNANLVSIHNDGENRFVSEIVAKIGQPIWLGAAIFDTSKNHENVDSSPFDYTNWQNGTRPAYKKSKKCVKISSENQEWFGDCCYNRPVPYICKKLAGKMGRPYWIPATNKTNNINPKFANKKGNTVMKQQAMKKETSDTVLPFVTKIYGNKNDIRKNN